MLRFVPAVLVAAGCHVTSQLEISRPGAHHRIEHRDQPVGKKPTIVLTDAGRFRFVEALECASEEVVDQQQTIETHRDPNLAAFVVGIAATAVGAIVLTTVALGKDPTGSPLFYAGGLGLALGLPLSVGPWVGRTTDLELGKPLDPVHQPGPNIPCGERPIVAPSATITINDTDVYGKIDPDGVFAVSPYELIDAFDARNPRPWNVSAALDAGNGATTMITAVIDGNALADHAKGWLTAAKWLDQRVEPMRLVPGIVAGTLRVSLTSTKDGPAVRVVLPLHNDGPGEAWAVRGQIASSVRAVDARMIYVGHLGRGEAVAKEILIPIAGDVAAMIRGATIMVSVELRDAHGTAPVTPVRFNGQVLVDLPEMIDVAIVGSGIAGLAAARALAGRHRVTLYEAAARPGGHVYTVDADGHAIDMGFIVCNRARYPHFMRMLGELGIATRPTTMSFSVALPAEDLVWGSADLGAMFADRRRLVDPRHWRFLLAVVAWLRRARADLDSALVRATSLDEYLAARATPRDLRDRFVIPLAAALWSLAPDRCGEFPAETYLRFLDQHGMLRTLAPLPWETIVGGSARYVDALVARLRAIETFTLALATPISTIARDARGATVVAGGREHRHDRVVIATHADTALRLLDAPSEAERRVLGAFRYSTNRTVLHRDRSFIPALPRAHAAWNYVGDPDTARVDVTYSMTRLQGLPDTPYLVTLNPRREPAGAIHTTTFEHPQFDRAALAAQRELPALGAGAGTYYCGAHANFGFHEDGMRSGLAAAARLMASP